MNDKLKYIIEQVLEEQWSSLTSSHLFGKDRDIVGTNRSPEESDIWGVTGPKELEYHHKLRDLEPTIRQSQQFKQFLEDLGHTNPNDQTSLFGMYENFLRYFAINRDEFQDGDNDDWTAAKAVAEYFKYHPERLE